MPEGSTAVTILFPFTGASASAAPEKPARLSRALADVREALAAQRRAVIDWRASLAALQDVVGSLGNAVLDYRAELAMLDGRLCGLHEEARRLEQLAGGAR